MNIARANGLASLKRASVFIWKRQFQGFLKSRDSFWLMDRAKGEDASVNLHCGALEKRGKPLGEGQASAGRECHHGGPAQCAAGQGYLVKCSPHWPWLAPFGYCDFLDYPALPPQVPHRELIPSVQSHPRGDSMTSTARARGFPAPPRPTEALPWRSSSPAPACQYQLAEGPTNPQKEHSHSLRTFVKVSEPSKSAGEKQQHSR